MIPKFILVTAWFAKKIWSREDLEGYIDLYEGYALLNWREQEVQINKGDLIIKIPKPQPFWYETYILKLPDRKITLISSVRENKEKKRGKRSLNIAIGALSDYKGSKK